MEDTVKQFDPYSQQLFNPAEELVRTPCTGPNSKPCYRGQIQRGVQDYLQAVSSTPSGTWINAEKRKSAKYTALLPMHDFSPVVVEALGVCGPEAISFGQGVRKKNGSLDWGAQICSVLPPAY